MVNISFKVQHNNLGALQGQIRGQSLKAVEQTMDDIHTDVMRRQHVPGRGIIYVHGGITHQASAPGQAPAAETGELIASYEVGVAMTPSGPVGIIHTDTEYAAALEYGAPGRGLAPRPSLTPAGEVAKKTLEAHERAALRKVG